MKIIQTYFNPYLKSENKILVNGGFATVEAHYMAWALSCSLLRNFYKEVELFTDDFGKVLFEKLEIPYDTIHPSLQDDFMLNLNPKMWAYAKIFTYSIQEHPFIHVDGDVFLWRPFDSRLLECDVIAQCVEDNMPIYRHSIKVLKETNGSYVPDWVNCSEKHPMAFNTGIMGSNNINLIKKYTSLAFQYYKNNCHLFDEMSIKDDNLNILPEQTLLYELCSKMNGLNVGTYFNSPIKKSQDFSECAQIEKVPYECHFVHTLGGFKRQAYICDFISMALRNENPRLWKNVKEYCRENIESNDKTIHVISGLEAKYQDFKKSINKKTKNIELLKSDFERLEKCHARELNTPNKAKVKFEPFPTYKIADSVVLDNLDFDKLIICPRTNLSIVPTEYNLAILFTEGAKEYVNAPFPYIIYSCAFKAEATGNIYHIWLDEMLFSLLLLISNKPTSITDLIAYIPNANKDVIINIIKSWYAYGLIGFSKDKNNFVPYVISDGCRNLKENKLMQGSQIIDKIDDFYGVKTSNAAKYLLDNRINGFTIAEFTQVLSSIGYEAKGIKTDSEFLRKYNNPLIAVVTLRQCVSLYVLILETNNELVRIFNPESKSEELYPIDYFNKIWSGIIIMVAR